MGVGWGSKEAEKLLCKKSFIELAAKTGYGRTVLNIQGKGIPNDGSSYRKTVRPDYQFLNVLSMNEYHLLLSHRPCIHFT